ncbi:chemotaxis response regulator protein-glutamate methylesterase [Clostridium sp. CX1]|uniref:protein-glutamate methylesterase/protein-glutamine glutaminase n=1 Tax=Clostridium sp. CX1 TaxID=2978346 RepID=UPI0021C1980B|nr:chemotaxis response regulator protein-glutamate methylesterase [Clostridium sp. CX1]MCT8977424.1 chemotaxis response regulator protein-glutamate methylesterase [Clostridium sp. CX1]
MKKFGVLVVDDSSFMRRCVSKLIEKDCQFFILGIARNGADAIEKVQRLKPDLVTMDIEMPEMDGLAALEIIMKNYPVPVVMISKHTDKETESTIKALELGAADFFLKEDLIGEDITNEIEKDFLYRIRTIAEKKSNTAKESIGKKVEEENRTTKSLPMHKVDLVAIGCSTGGPSALQAILPRFPKDFNVPIIVMQHMPPGFTKSLAERFNTLCNLNVKEIEDGEIIEAGNIYIAPSGFQTTINRRQDGTDVFNVSDKLVKDILYKPSINVTLKSLAPIYKDKLLSVILTGMGNDGLEGCKLVKHYEGHVIAEAEESCVVYGMPKVVFEGGYADTQVPLSYIYEQIMIHI